ncbi:MAG: NAD(P)/FAD-dependent oxidoreductase [Archangium sp.]|nr:NAD(P)/FAD-dependent oxidoreductase [Archangium sp.]
MSSPPFDVAIIGGGPAGLATAIGAALRGLKVHVFDKQSGPIDKACGEGLMPSGLSALERLGALKHLDRSDTAPFESIVYVQESGTRAEGKLPPPGGLGVRRLALSGALRTRALEVGVVLHEHSGVRSHARTNHGIELSTDTETFTAGVLVGADGLHSATREREGLAGPVATLRRFGLRRHLALAPWNRSVEVHFARGVEAYLTPAGVKRVGVAFLWEAGAVPGDIDFASLLAHFPALQERFRDVAFDSTPRGAGPLLQHVKRRVAPRFALVGDAAGYVDAITGEGLSQAFEGAEALVAVLPEVLARGGAVEAFAPYEVAAEKAFSRYARLAHLLVWTARHPRLRRSIIGGLARSPRLFERILRQVAG